MQKAMTERFANGSIINYPYLWQWQAAKGRENAEKERPVCLALTIPDLKLKLTHLVILPISSTEPFDDQTALEIPALEIRRAGLSPHKRSWITVSEYNYDIAERSFYLEPNQMPKGQFSPQFLEVIRAGLRPFIASRQGRVNRSDP